jgi:hypothetical protein
MPACSHHILSESHRLFANIGYTTELLLANAFDKPVNMRNVEIHLRCEETKERLFAISSGDHIHELFKEGSVS